MASYLDKGTVKFVLLAALFAFMLQARPPQQEVDPFERPVGWFPGASRPSNRSTLEGRELLPGEARATSENATNPTANYVTSVGITCGEPKGATYTTSDGRTFISDWPYLGPGTEDNIGDFSFTDGYSVEGASEQGLYVRERFGPIVYTFPQLENGVYQITFYETEAWFNAAGERVFAVYIDDVLTTQSSVDLFERAGGRRIAVDFTLEHTVVEHQMVVSFQGLVDQPKVNAMWVQKVRDLPAEEVPTEVPTATEAVPAQEAAAPEYVRSVGVNCGSTSAEPYIDADGRVFVNDAPYFVNGTGLGVGDFSAEDGFSIEGTDDTPLYVTERFGPIVYNFPNLENGVYWVTFYETEAWWTEPGQRVFDVYIDGKLTSQTQVDLFKRTGRQRVVANFGLFYYVKDHQMSIEFGKVVDEPKVNAIWIQKVRDLLPPELPATPAPAVPTAAPVVPTAAPEVPTAAPEVPTAAPEVPTAAPVVPTPPPEVPTPVPEVPTPAPEVSTEAPVSQAEGGAEASAVDQSPATPPAPVLTPMPEEGQSSSAVPEWILKGLPISFYSTLACTAVAGPIAELFGYKTVVSVGAFARVLIQLVLLFNMPLAAAQIQYGIGAAADVILVAFLFLHVAERHFQLATSAVLAASALGVVGAAAISQLMQYFMPDVLIQWLPLGSTLLAAFLASLLPQDPLRDELDRTKGGSSRLPLRGFFGREGLVGEFITVYKSKPIWILSFWWVFASAVNASLLNYAPDLLTEINPDTFFNGYAINIVHILSAAGALIAIKLAAPVARTGGLAFFVGSLVVGLFAVGSLFVEKLGMAYTSLVLTAGIAQLLLCLVFAQSASLVSNGRFALLFGTNATLALLVQGATQLTLDHMGWHIGQHFFILGLASICGALLFGLMCAVYQCATGRAQLVNAEDLAGDYNLIGGSRHGSQNRLPVYEIQDESAWKTDDVDLDDDDEGNVEMLGLVEGRPQVVKDEGSLSRV